MLLPISPSPSIFGTTKGLLLLPVLRPTPGKEGREENYSKDCREIRHCGLLVGDQTLQVEEVVEEKIEAHFRSNLQCLVEGEVAPNSPNLGLWDLPDCYYY